MSKWFLPGVLCVVCLLLGGCADAKIVRVSGTVRYLGKPVPNLVVKFVPPEGRSSTGFTDDQGHYDLRYDKQHEGAVRGMHKVFFAVRPRNPEEEMAMQRGTLQVPPEFTAILEKYGKNTSTLSREVTRDGQVIDFDLD